MMQKKSPGLLVCTRYRGTLLKKFRVPFSIKNKALQRYKLQLIMIIRY